MSSWLLAFRFKTLTAALVPILVSAALVFLKRETMSWWVLGLLLVASFSIQIATNLFNDAIDHAKGADKERVGPVRVTQSGLLSARSVYLMAGAFCLLALACGIPLVERGGLPIVIIGVISLFLAYGYTGGPFPLAYLGLGDLFVILFFGVIAVEGSFYLFALRWSWDALVLGFQVGCLATILIAMNNLRDLATDAKVGKKTLAVRFGARFIRREIFWLLLISYGLCLYWYFQYRHMAFLLFWFTIPLALKLRFILREGTAPVLIRGLGLSALLHLLFGLTFCLAVAGEIFL